MKAHRRRVVRWLLLTGLLALPLGEAASSPVDQPTGAEVAGQTPSVPTGRQPFLVQLTRVQRRLNDALAREMRLVRRGETAAVVTVMLVALAYGVVHAVGPGHGKAVVAALFLGREAHPVRGVAVGFLVSFLQIASSIATVAVLAFLLRHSSLAVSEEAVWVEVVSYGLITAMGLYLTIVAVTGRGEHASRMPWGAAAEPGRRPPPDRLTGGLVLAAGLTPCPSGIIVLLFALANGVFAVGIGASLVMALGMGVTVSAIGVATIVIRRSLLHPLRARPRAIRWGTRTLVAAGSVTLTVVAGLLCVGAWTRLP